MGYFFYPAVDFWAQGGKVEMRRIRIPPHRYTPLRENWENIMRPVVEHLKLLIRVNPANRSVELKVRQCGGHSVLPRPGARHGTLCSD